jgi:hypothetical protein
MVALPFMLAFRRTGIRLGSAYLFLQLGRAVEGFFRCGGATVASNLTASSLVGWAFARLVANQPPYVIATTPGCISFGASFYLTVRLQLLLHTPMQSGIPGRTASPPLEPHSTDCSRSSTRHH